MYQQHQSEQQLQSQASERLRVPLYINSDEPDLLECLPGVTHQLVHPTVNPSIN